MVLWTMRVVLLVAVCLAVWPGAASAARPALAPRHKPQPRRFPHPDRVAKDVVMQRLASRPLLLAVLAVVVLPASAAAATVSDGSMPNTGMPIFKKFFSR